MISDSDTTTGPNKQSAGSASISQIASEANAQSVRILIFNDHPVFRSALSWKIGMESGVEVVADSPSLYETLALANSTDDQTGVNAVVADLRIGDGNSEGVESIRTLTTRLGGIPVVVCSDQFSRSFVERLQKAGATEVLQKSGDIDQLVEAIHAAAAQSHATTSATTTKRAA